MDRLNKLEILQNPEMSYAVAFHFNDTTTEATLVIQHEMTASKYMDELEMAERNWLSVPKLKNERPLELTVVDFDRFDSLDIVF